jgi:hypothetical protein
MIDSGVPPGRDHWPDGILEALLPWEQGDLVQSVPIFYFADSGSPIWNETAAYTSTSLGPEVILASDNAPYGMVTTQTCDIAEEESTRPMRPWVQLAPVYKISDKGWAKKLQQGGGPRYWLWVPGIPEDGVWTADLRIEIPVEKGWLAGQPRIEGFPSEETRQAVPRRLEYLRGRPAFSREFNAAVYVPLIRLLDEASGEESTDGIAGLLAEVAVQVDSYLHPNDVQLIFLSDDPLPGGVRERLRQWKDAVGDTAREAGITIHALEFGELSAVSLARYRRMVTLWLP